MIDWRPIETAPKGNEESTWEPGPDILLYDHYKMAVGYWCNANKEWVTDYRGKGNFDYVSATHWQPLPEPPQ